MAIVHRFVFLWATLGVVACDDLQSEPAPAPPPPIFSQVPVHETSPASDRSKTEPSKPGARPAADKASADPTPADRPSVAPRENESPPEVEPALDARLVRVTDGDTIVVEIDGKRERIRLIGIDTPETKHSRRGPEPLADEATDALREHLGRHRLELRFDAEERDHYGRLLAYVYANDVFVNEAMVRDGWARALRVPPNVRHAKRFDRLAQDARRRRLGIWAISD